ncbi:MAG: M28 family peptidase [Candidatus Helarchaeota archaeon]
MSKALHENAPEDNEIQKDPQLIESVEAICKGKNPFEHIKAMDYPRMAGTPGEKQAATYIISKFREYGFNPITESFYIPESSIISKLVIPICFIVWGTFSYLNVMFISGILESIFAICILMIPVFVVVIFLKLDYLFKKIIIRNYQKMQHLKRTIEEGQYKRPIRQSTNIAVEYTPASYSKHLYLTAHYDSTTLKLNMKIIKWGMFFGLLGGMVYLFGYIAHYLILLFSQYNLFGTYPLVFLSCLLLFLGGVGGILFARAFRTNKSHGAIDDLTGTALILELARIVKEIQPSLKITFIVFSAEEIGFYGSIFHYYTHKGTFDSKNLHVVSIDMIGEISPLTFIEKIKPFFSIPLDPQFNNELMALARRLGIATKLGMFVYPGSDFANWFVNGFRTNWIMTPSKFIHSAQDTAANVNQDLVNQCLKVFTGYLIERAI